MRPSRLSRRPRTLALAAVTVLGLASCTQVSAEMRAAEPYECPPEECDPPQPDGPGGSLVIEADEFFFDIIEGEVAEGTIEVTLINVGGAEHDITIDESFGDPHVPPGETDYLDPGETYEGEFELFAGEYVYYCSVPGHRAAGMEGTIDIPMEREPVEPTDPEVQTGAPAGDTGEDDAVPPGDEDDAPANLEEPDPNGDPEGDEDDPEA
jgi:plastocyanin